MQRSAFVYTIYIKTTPEQLWQALIDPASTRRDVTEAFRRGKPSNWPQISIGILHRFQPRTS